MPYLAQTTRGSLVPRLGRSPAFLSLLHPSILTLCLGVRPPLDKVPYSLVRASFCMAPSVLESSVDESDTIKLEIEGELSFRERILDNAYCSMLAYAPQRDRSCQGAIRKASAERGTTIPTSKVALLKCGVSYRNKTPGSCSGDNGHSQKFQATLPNAARI